MKSRQVDEDDNWVVIMDKFHLDKAIECIRSYCDKHTCRNCKFSRRDTEPCMFKSSPCDWMTAAETGGEENETDN